jgi:citrate synthase
MRGPKQLFEFENNWITDMGACFPGQGRTIFRGQDIFENLKGLSWMALLLYGITGRIPDAKQTRLFEGIWTLCTSYPDPRLWNNRVAALAGTSRSTAALAISAANAVSDATIYGHRPIIRSIDFLLRTKQQLEHGRNLSDLINIELKTHRTIAGYGRPLASRDERIKPMMDLAQDLGLSDGPYVALAFAIEETLISERRRLYMNIAALLAALAADQGMSRSEYHHFMILCFSAGMFPGYIDAVNKPEGTFFPMRCSHVRYAGPPERDWDDNKRNTGL